MLLYYKLYNEHYFDHFQAMIKPAIPFLQPGDCLPNIMLVIIQYICHIVSLTLPLNN